MTEFSPDLSGVFLLGGRTNLQTDMEILVGNGKKLDSSIKYCYFREEITMIPSLDHISDSFELYHTLPYVFARRHACVSAEFLN